MKTAVMGEKSDAVRILFKVWKSLLLPRSEFTFLDTYLGPGCGSIPSSFRFLIHSTDRRRDAVASVHLPFSLARWRASSLSLRVLRRGRTWWQACIRLAPLLCHGGGGGLGSVAVAQNSADFAALACMRIFAAVFFSAAV